VLAFRSDLAGPASPPPAEDAAQAPESFTPRGTPHRGDAQPPAALRFFVAALLMGVAKLFASLLSGVPVLSLLAVTSVGFFAAGALFGWAGLAAAALVQAGYTSYYFGFELESWAGYLPYVATGAIAWLVFRHVPGLGRGFPNFSSLRWFALAAVAAGLLSSSFISLVSGAWFEAVTVWARSTVVSIWLLTPPLLIVGVGLFPRWLARIPGEVTRPMPRQVALVTELEAGSRLETLNLRSRPVDTWAVAVACLVAAGAVFAGTLLIGWDPALLWWSLLFVGPIWWAASRLRLRGGLVAAGVVSLLVLSAYSVLFREVAAPSGIPVGIYGMVLLFWLFGAFLGLAAERQADLVDGLVDVNDRLRGDLQRVVRALSGALGTKDAYTEGHLQRVTGYAMEVGRRLGIEGRQLELLQIASTLHDVGKIGIAENILSKPGPLDEQQWEAMRKHPEIGARLLSSLDGLQDAAPLVLHHQERWDGKTRGEFPGYPAGLRGREIPLGARIIAVVDCFDAMTTDRPYRRAYDEEQARRELLAERGRQFDPQVVDTFLAILDEAPWRESA